MSLIRKLKNLKQKDVMVINDVPVKSEIEGSSILEDDGTVSLEYIPFSAASNINLLTSLRTGNVLPWSEVPREQQKGIIKTKIHTTYLDYTYYGEGEVEKNFDFNKEFKKKSQIEDGEVFHKLEHKKDLYVSSRLWEQFQSLLQEIREVGPKLIIVTGKWGLFFLTGMPQFGETSGTTKDRKPLGALVKYRASIMKIHECFGEFSCIVFPIWHTIHHISMPERVPMMQYDLQKAAYIYHTTLEKGIEYFQKPEKNIILGTTYETCINVLSNYLDLLHDKPILVSIDVETLYSSYIDCIGIAISKDEGICIPFATIDNPNLWTKEEEIEILSLIREIMEHPNSLHLGQNYQYDCQYFYKMWLMDVKASHDTMVLHHILYNYLPKDLAFLASIYCEHYTYWKNEIGGKEI